MTTKRITTAAIVAAAYAAISLLLAPISFGPIQCRISEALTLLPMMFSAAVPGLFIGCLVANILSGAVWLDVVFGSLATLIAAVCTYKCKNKWIGAAYPVIVNALIVGTYLAILYKIPIWLAITSVGVGQAVACYGLGIPFIIFLEKHLKNRTF